VSNFLDLVIAGFALGAQYALVALGFVIIFKATHVINFAQGAFVVLGAYLTYNFHVTWDLPFALAVVMAMVGGALVGVIVERLILRWMIGQPVFALIIATVGLLIVIQEIVHAIWGVNPLSIGDPWGLKTVELGDGIVVSHVELWTIALTGLVLLAFFAFFRYSSLGLAMRATALDQEAALAQGISARRVFATSWAIAGVVAALAGVTLASGRSGGVDVGVGFIALAAFPAMILGGLDSPLGSVVGGIVIGVSQTLTQGYQPQHADFLGTGFHEVMPYVVMILILLVRPYGLFGTPEVRRV
jgi:branched-chain amino acid transport system permease protein